MKQKPSDYFLGAILRGYDRALDQHGRVQPADIWDNICIECIRRPGAFETMFAWDTRNGRQNRIGTIIECLEAGLVPTLRLERNKHGRAYVVKDALGQKEGNHD